MNDFLPLKAAGKTKPKFGSSPVPRHVAIVMDGNGRWANARGLTRIEGHKAGELALLDVVAGAIEAGVEYLTVFAFSTENWKRSPEEVRFLMGYNVEVLRRRRDQLDHWGVRIRWSGRPKRLWRSVVRELDEAAEQTKRNKTLTLTMCVNYGARQEIIDAVEVLASEVAAGKIKPASITERMLEQRFSSNFLPDVDLFIRSSGEQRISNFLLWQSAYAELVFDDTPWPDFDRTNLWAAISDYTNRDRRFGGAVDKPAKRRRAN